MAKPTKEERRKELEKEIEDYVGNHSRGEAYEFNIKVRYLNIPSGARRNFEPDVIDASIESFYRQALNDFTGKLKSAFPWIHNWSQEGRSGGWLVLEPDYGLIGKDAGLVTLRQRLADLDKIDEWVKASVRVVKLTLSSKDFWDVKKQDWSPRD